jgi:uncharacterized protein (TIGR02246 family)
MNINGTALAVCALLLIGASAPTRADDVRDSVCPKHLHQRTVEQVLSAHLAAFPSGNAEMVACDYAADAIFIMPSTVVRGRDDIESAFAGFFALAGAGIQVSTISSTIADDVALLEYTVSSSHVTVSDGVDSFVVDNGLIVAQTGRLGGLAVK